MDRKEALAVKPSPFRRLSLFRGIPIKSAGGCGRDGNGACDDCGRLFLLPCFRCNGSCKVVKGWHSATVAVRCTECNEREALMRMIFDFLCFVLSMKAVSENRENLVVT
ncbi:unnamed protein product [Microthlaspi erraticum]|uniref:Uncharacterized protein n=1 Tax=Microthlaspi erraticum TaxID=1685480 RepID=A0A6D2IRL6_9BRAS|nr:unnamed protein product [Microthlaspi erraticum]